MASGGLSQEELVEVASSCACTAVRRTARSLTRAYDEALRPTGLRITQFALLVAAALGEGTLTLSRMSGVLGLERTTLTRVLRPLEQRGLIEVRVGDDRRARTVAVTAAGRELMAEALPLWRAAQARVVSGEAAEPWERLAADLARVAEAAGR
jgi:DNA-binding MarR family transcriptional regulator